MTQYLDTKPYLIDAIIGNSRFLASLLHTGRMVRLWWPHVDLPQHIDTVRSGIRMSGTNENTTWFDESENGWQHKSQYVHQTNIFTVRAESPNYPIMVTSSHFAVPAEDILVLDYQFTNTSTSPVSFQFVFFTSFMATENPFYHTTQFDESNDSMMHFRNNYYFLASSANVCTKFQACHAWDNAQNGTLNGNLIQMAPDGAMEWTFTDIAPGETIQMPVYICAGHNMESAVNSLKKAKSRTASEWINTTANYWQQFLQSASPCPIDQPEINELYQRSLLTMKLMTDERTGSIIAAPEFDERFSLCGGYAYCWGRDAAFITTALDKAGLSHLSTRFYEWTLTAQHKDGSWQQRHYHDGSLAPSWGLQIDEGASIIWGMFQHYEALPVVQKDRFLKLIWEAVKLGASFLTSWIDEETGLPLPSMDLWEEREAEHTYSSAAVYGGLIAAAAFAEQMQETALSANWRKAANRISESIRTLCWNEANGVFYRGVKLTVTEREYQRAAASGLPITSSTSSKGYAKYLLQYDPVIDVSLLGCSMPFAVIPPNHPQAVSTADAIQRELTVPGIGGIKRYENDSYIGGNPWILTTLWLAQYRASNKQFADARDLLDWAVAHQTPFGLLPEQIDRNTGDTAWVVPLTWSHAMFILTVHLIAEGES